MRGIEIVIHDTTFGNFWKCRSITRSVFKYRLSCTHREFGWRIVIIHSWRERNRSRILYRPSTNCKMICAVISASPAIFLRSSNFSTYLYGKTSLRVSNSNSSFDSIENVRFLICLCLETSIYRDLHLEIWKNQWILILHNFSENSFHFCLWCYR